MSNLQIETLREGTRAIPHKGQSCVIHYKCWLPNGRMIASSMERYGRPFEFTLGAGRVIKEWDQAVATMRVGGKIKLTVPPTPGARLADNNSGIVPANSTLVFEIELLGVFDEWQNISG